DVGGGSTELIYTRPSLSIASIRSVRLGAVRLQQWENYSAKVTKKEYKNLWDVVQETLEDANLPVVARDTYTIGVGGTMGAILDAVHHGTTETKPSFSAAELNQLLDAMVGKSPEELEEEFGVDRKRGQIIVPGGVVVSGIMD